MTALACMQWCSVHTGTADQTFLLMKVPVHTAEVSDMTACMLAATGHTASWTLYAVSQDAEVEAKIVEELRGLGLLATHEHPEPRLVEWEDLPKLTYLNAVIKVWPLSRLSWWPRCTSRRI